MIKLTIMHTLHLLFMVCVPCISITFAAAMSARKISFKVNVGGGPVGDFLGEEQVIDLSAFPKNTARANIENTDQPEVFQSQRFSRTSDFTMRIPVPDGVYALTLLFAETFQPACVPGGRVFDISLGTVVSGVKPVVEKFDVFQAAGCNGAHGKRFDNVPSKGGIVVHLARHAQHPSLCGFIVEGFAAPGQDSGSMAAGPVHGGSADAPSAIPDIDASSVSRAEMPDQGVQGGLNTQTLSGDQGLGGLTSGGVREGSVGTLNFGNTVSASFDGSPGGGTAFANGMGSGPNGRRRLLAHEGVEEEILAAEFM